MKAFVKDPVFTAYGNRAIIEEGGGVSEVPRCAELPNDGEMRAEKRTRRRTGSSQIDVRTVCGKWIPICLQYRTHQAVVQRAVRKVVKSMVRRRMISPWQLLVLRVRVYSPLKRSRNACSASGKTLHLWP
jgi:hypothetical protein